MRIPTFTQFQRQTEMIATQFDQMSRLQAQASSGKKLINNSDDPVLAGQITSTEDFIEKLNGFSHNAILAQNRGNDMDTALKNAIAKVSDIQRIIQNSRNGTLKDEDRANLAKQLRGGINSLLTLANSQNAQGKYIFSGSNTSLPPFVQNGSNYQYQGSYDPTMIDIGPNFSTIYCDSGNNVFGNIPTGNGTYTVDASSSNTGTAATSAGTVISQNYVSDTYTLSFATNGAGETVYQIVGATSGQVVPTPPATIPTDSPVYKPGTNGFDIPAFNGISLNVHGDAKAGDTFTIAPSTKQDVFTALEGIADLLESPLTNQGSFDQAISQGAAVVEQAFSHFVGYQSQIGIRNIAIDSQIKSNEENVTAQKIVLKNLGDSDMTDVYTRLAQQSLALQATQQSYLKIQDVLNQLLKM